MNRMVVNDVPKREHFTPYNLNIISADGSNPHAPLLVGTSVSPNLYPLMRISMVIQSYSKQFTGKKQSPRN